MWDSVVRVLSFAFESKSISCHGREDMVIYDGVEYPAIQRCVANENRSELKRFDRARFAALVTLAFVLGLVIVASVAALISLNGGDVQVLREVGKVLCGLAFASGIVGLSATSLHALFASK